MYTIDWIGTVATGLLQDGKPRLCLVLEDGQQATAEFKEGDQRELGGGPPLSRGDFNRGCPILSRILKGWAELWAIS